ncbi:MAG TPA: topoisomerase C-terminal repeat-containing protein, partial [Burkholderiaceae bacterium]|nr:topoisomerase C-terminal repeat-containing protein [Burkholderiaceae bacterium]
VFEQPMNYLCERATGPEKSCDFRSGKVILQQPIERTQMEKLLRDGRTDVLRGFISNRTRRKFAAFLVRKPDGTVGFEFEPRTKAPAKSARAKPASDAAEADMPRRAARRTPEKTAAPDTDSAARAVKTATRTTKKSAARRTTAAAAKPTARKAARR